MYIYIYIIYIYIYICNHENNVPSRLSPQWPWATSIRGQSNIFNKVFLAVNYFRKKSSLVDTLLSKN